MIERRHDNPVIIPAAPVVLTLCHRVDPSLILSFALWSVEANFAAIWVAAKRSVDDFIPERSLEAFVLLLDEGDHFALHGKCLRQN